MGSNEQKEPAGLKDVLNHPLSRRHFLAATGVAAATAGVAGLFVANRDAAAVSPPDDLETSSGVSVRYSVCLSCHSKCGIRVRVKNDSVLKIDGNPWHPNNAETGERLAFSATMAEALSAPATLCPKGQSGVEVMYNPFRIAGPLKRVGARGAGQWESISWDQALTEIADAARPYFEGHADGTLLPTADGSGTLGTIANQVIFSPGRFQHGQKEFTDRIFKLGFGTVNYRHDHTSICETSHHVAGSFFTERFSPELSAVKDHFKPDMLESEYILWFGTNPLEANFPTQTLAKRVAKGRNAGVKHVIIDPRHSRSCAFAHRWLPIKPRGDVALTLGIAQRMIAQGNYDVAFLEAINELAAKATVDWSGGTKDLQYNTTDASWLVVVDAADPGLKMIFHKNAGAYVALDPATGIPFSIDRAITAAAQWGRLELDGTEPNTVLASSLNLRGVGSHVLDINGDGTVYVAPVFQLYKATAFAHDLAYYASESGIDVETIIAVADEFAAAGHKAVAEAYRGAAQHTNGVNTMQATLILNMLVGNFDWKGGALGGTGGHLHEMGGSAGQLALDKQATVKRSTSGPQLTRVKQYFNSTLASALGEQVDNPTRRPWFPFAYNGNYQEIVPSIEDRYPYAAGILFSYWNNLPYSSPSGADGARRVLTDESLLPLHVCFDIEMSEMASLADYVLPDGSYFERWTTPHNSPTILSKLSPFRSPVVGYYATKRGGTGNETYWEALANRSLGSWNYAIDWATETGPFTVEDISVELMRRVAGGNLDNVPAFGTNAFYASEAAKDAAVHPLHRNQLKTAWDWYWNILVNWAIEAGASTDAEINEMAHRIVERGGWFQDTGVDGTNEYSGAYAKNKTAVSSKGKSLHFFFEYTFPTTHEDWPGQRYVDPYSKKHYNPLPEVVPVVDAAGEEVRDSNEYALRCVTYKPIWHSQGRTASIPSLTVLQKENFVEMSSADARVYGLRGGDLVKVTSASNTKGVVGRLHVGERIRPGVIAMSHSRGRWEINSRAYGLDGQLTDVAPIRGAGVTCNPILRLDPAIGNVTLQDPIGGSASFYDTKVKVERLAL